VAGLLFWPLAYALTLIVSVQMAEAGMTTIDEPLTKVPDSLLEVC